MQFDNIPQELIAIDQWVLWKAHDMGGSKPTKVPYQPNGKKASATANWTWSDFSMVRSAYEEGGYDGVGFVLTKGDLVGIDIDHCIEDGELSEVARGIIDKCDSYTEVSPSGKGIRIFVRSRNPTPTAKSPVVEIYSHSRYLTITGNVLDEPKAIRYADDGILHALRFARPQKPPQAASPDPIIEKLKERGLYRQQVSPGVHQIICPWVHEHTDGDESGTKYLQANFNGFAHPTFHCHHAHCADRRLDHLRAFLGESTQNGYASELFWTGPEIFEEAPDVEWVIEKYLTAGTVSLLYAPKDSFKSYLSLDMGLSCASDRAWHGYLAKKGTFIYVCGEGRYGIASRMNAWATHYMIDPKTLPILMGKGRMRLDDEQKMIEISDEIIRLIDAYQYPPPALLVVDTLSSSTPGMEENDAGAMARAMDHLKLLIAERLMCAVLLVHHTGKDVERGARGSSAIEANAEAVFTIEREDSEGSVVTFHTKHIKDQAKPDPILLTGITQMIDEMHSNLVFVDVESKMRGVFMSDRQQEKATVLRLLREGKTTREVEAEMAAYDMKVSQKTVSRWSQKFRELGYL